MAEPYKIHKLDGEGYFDVSKHPDTLRIEIYWKDKARWAMVADIDPLDLMVEEATRVLKQMVYLIALGGVSDTHKGKPKVKK